MLPDLEQLISLQQLDTAAKAARGTVDGIPSRIENLETRLNTRTVAVETAKNRLAVKKDQRQALEKNLAEVQGRLSRFKEQLMSVKTNKEYKAIQHEIATAQTEVQRLEDTILEYMLEADELTADVESTEQAMRKEQEEVQGERAAIEAERAHLERRLAETSDERTKLVGNIGVSALRLFDSIAEQRRGVAVVEARDGHCTICNVRLRPQVFNEILLNTELIQCDSCMRILYHDPDGGRSQAPEHDPAR